MRRWIGRAVCVALAAIILLLMSAATWSSPSIPGFTRRDRFNFSDSPADANNSDYVIQWEDPAVEAMVRTALEKPSGDILRSELDFVESVYIAGGSHIYFNIGRALDGSSWQRDEYYIDGVRYSQRGEITSLKDFAHFQNLDTLTVLYNKIEDLSGVAALNRVEQLNIGLNHLSDLTPLGELTQLTLLTIWGNDIVDISPLANLKDLQFLYAAENKIEDAAPLSGLTNLQELNLRDNNISGEQMEWLQAQLPDCYFRS